MLVELGVVECRILFWLPGEELVPSRPKHPSIGRGGQLNVVIGPRLAGGRSEPATEEGVQVIVGGTRSAGHVQRDLDEPADVLVAVGGERSLAHWQPGVVVTIEPHEWPAIGLADAQPDGRSDFRLLR